MDKSKLEKFKNIINKKLLKKPKNINKYLNKSVSNKKIKNTGKNILKKTEIKNVFKNKFDINQIFIFFICCALIQTFDNTIKNYIINNSVRYILDFIALIFLYLISFALNGQIFLIIMLIIFTGFIIFIYYDLYRFKECSKNNDVLIYPFLLLSLYFYLNQYIKNGNSLEIRKLADCTYSSFAKILMFFCLMLSLSYRSTNMFIFSTILLIYMLST